MTITLNADYDVTLNTALLGYVGETNARPMSVEGMEIDGADRYMLTIDYGDGVTYEVDITGGQWTPTADILRSAQTVSCQICAKKLSGDEYVLVKKSRIFRLRIGAAIGDNAVPSPDVSMDALDRIDAIGRQAHADMQTAVTAAETATTMAENAAKSATAAEKSADTAEQAASRAETAQASAETSATQADTAMQGAETARQQAVAAQNSAKVSAAQASTVAQQTEADKTITAGYAKTAKTNADSTAADRQAVADMATQVTADKATVADHAAQVATDRKAAETAAQTAQSIADSLPDDYVTAVGKIAENTADISAIKLTDKELKRRVDALFDMGQGVTHKFETDSETAYAKTVPTGAKLMSVKNIGGRSIVFNQIFQPRKEANNGATVTADSDGTITINGTTTASYINFRDVTPEQNKIGKYMFKLLILNNPDSISMKFGFLNRSQSTPAITSGSSAVIYNQTQSEISLGKATGISGLAIGTVFTNVKIKIQIFDLTTMFGAGNEPASVEEFEKIFPATYYPYNAGEIVSAGVTEVVEESRNKIYEKWQGYSIDVLGTYVRNSNFDTHVAKIIKGRTYTVLGGAVYGLHIDKPTPSSKTYDGIRHATDMGYTFSAPIDVYVTMRAEAGMQAAIWEGTVTPTAYTPYHRNEYQIPEAIRNLPGYGWSAGTAKNYVDYENKRYVQCVQSVDLGTLTWTAGGGSKITFIASSQKIYGQKLSYNSNIASNILCSKYLAKSQNEIWSNATSMGIATNATIDGYIYVNDTSYTDATAFKQAMSGVMLYYELANPIITDISTLIDDDFLRNLTVEAGGSITFKNGNGDSYRIPVPSEDEYIVKLSEVGGTT